jgi:hypothetical protein
MKGLSPSPIDGDYSPTFALRVEKVRPRLHHLAAFLDVLRSIVGSPHFAAFGVRELALNDIWPESHLIQRGGCDRAETLSRHPPAISRA